MVIRIFQGVLDSVGVSHDDEAADREEEAWKAKFGITDDNREGKCDGGTEVVVWKV